MHRHTKFYQNRSNGCREIAFNNYQNGGLHLWFAFLIQLEFCCDLWRQKTRVSILSCGITFSRFDAIPMCKTDTQTDRHTTTAYTALNIVSRCKNHARVIFQAYANHVSNGAFVLNFGILGVIADVITHASFFVNRFRGFGVPTPKILLSP